MSETTFDRYETDDGRPMVSIGLPIFNAENHVRAALDSLLAQTFEGFELIISDNASTDDTGRICREYAERDSRIRYHRNERNIGITANTNRVFELADGHFFMLASHDDEWEPTFIIRCLDVMLDNPFTVLCYPKARFVGPDGKPSDYPLPSFDTRGMTMASRFHTVIWGIAYAHQTYGLMKSSALDAVLPLRPVLAADHAFLAELSILGDFAHVPERLFYVRRPATERWVDEVDNMMAKIGKPVTTRRSAYRWFFEMVLNHLRVVNKQVGGRAVKLTMMASTLICLFMKYKWLLRALLDVSEYKRTGKLPKRDREDADV